MGKDRFGFSPSDGDDHISVRGLSDDTQPGGVNCISVVIIFGIIFIMLYFMLFKMIGG